MQFKKLICDENNPQIKKFANVLYFSEIGKINIDYVKEAFDFAYSMTFGNLGEHRNHRTGGTHKRKKGEIFANTFQGKLCEFAIYQELKGNHDINKPDLSVFGLGKWDNYDFKVDGKTVSIKSTKHFGQLLLLEAKDWTANGEYIPNNKETYDFTFVVRIKNDPETIMKSHYLLFNESYDKDNLWSLFKNNDWAYDIPGYITQKELIYLIANGFIIKKGDFLNGKTKMDAENYYCHLADMHRFKINS